MERFDKIKKLKDTSIWIGNLLHVIWFADKLLANAFPEWATQPQLTKIEQKCQLELVEIWATTVYNNHTNSTAGGLYEYCTNMRSAENIPIV